MMRLLRLFVFAGLAGPIAAQDWMVEEAACDLARAEALVQAGQVEDAILVAWSSFDMLADRDAPPPEALKSRTTLQKLLATHDPQNERRRAVQVSIAKLHVDLAAAYRAKKWFAVAASRLQVADSFDPATGANERRLLASAAPGEPPEAVATAESPDPAAAARLAVEAATQLIAKKLMEPASVQLRHALDRANALEPGNRRDELAKEIEALLARTDPLTDRRRLAARQTATQLVSLANEYSKAGRFRAAARLVDRAWMFDAAGTEKRRAEARRDVEKWTAAELAAHADELKAPADDGKLAEWFAKGFAFAGAKEALTIDGSVARAQLGSMSMVAWKSDEKPPLRSAAVHVRLDERWDQGGLCVDIVDEQDFLVVVLERRTGGLSLTVHRSRGKQWQRLARRDIPMAAWRLDAWHELSVVSDAKGLSATCGDVVVAVPRSALGRVTGSFGLYACTGSGDPCTVELRGFRPGT